MWFKSQNKKTFGKWIVKTIVVDKLLKGQRMKYEIWCAYNTHQDTRVYSRTCSNTNVMLYVSTFHMLNWVKARSPKNNRRIFLTEWFRSNSKLGMILSIYVLKQIVIFSSYKGNRRAIVRRDHIDQRHSPVDLSSNTLAEREDNNGINGNLT